jgi:hypothetical protein
MGELPPPRRDPCPPGCRPIVGRGHASLLINLNCWGRTVPTIIRRTSSAFSSASTATSARCTATCEGPAVKIAAICLSLYIPQRLRDTQTQRHKRHTDTQTPRDAARDSGRQWGTKGGAAPAGARACRAGSPAPSRPPPPPRRGKEEKGAIKLGNIT